MIFPVFWILKISSGYKKIQKKTKKNWKILIVNFSKWTNAGVRGHEYLNLAAPALYSCCFNGKAHVQTRWKPQMDQMFETQGINYNSIRAKFRNPKSFKTFFSNLFQPFKIARWHFEGGNWISFFPSGAEMRLRLLSAFLIADFWKRNIRNNLCGTLKLLLLFRSKL